MSARTGKTIHEVPSAVLRALQEYSWPGNVRQLQNVLEEAVVTSQDGVLRLREHFDSAPMKGSGRRADLRSLAEAERDHILRVLETTSGQVAGKGGAAEILDLHPNTLRSRMKKLGISSRGDASERP